MGTNLYLIEGRWVDVSPEEYERRMRRNDHELVTSVADPFKSQDLPPVSAVGAYTAPLPANEKFETAADTGPRRRKMIRQQRAEAEANAESETGQPGFPGITNTATPGPTDGEGTGTTEDDTDSDND